MKTAQHLYNGQFISGSLNIFPKFFTMHSAWYSHTLILANLFQVCHLRVELIGPIVKVKTGVYYKWKRNGGTVIGRGPPTLLDYG